MPLRVACYNTNCLSVNERLSLELDWTQTFGEPIGHQIASPGAIVDLTMLNTPLVGRKDLQGLVFGGDGFVSVYGVLDRHLAVALAVEYEDRTGDLPGHTLKRHGLGLGQHVLGRVRAERPQGVVGGIWDRRSLIGFHWVSLSRQQSIEVEERTPHGQGLDALLKGRRAWREISTHADARQPDGLGLCIGPPFKVVEDHAHIVFGLDLDGKAVQSQRTPCSRLVDDEA